MATGKSLRKDHKLSENLALLPSEQKEFEKFANVESSKVTRRGVVYLGHIPYGFFENQMRAYFSQFGKVTRLRLSRSKRTGKSKGFAFIEFLSGDVAKIVAETMNNYLLFENLLKCRFIPPEEVKLNLFKGCNRKFTLPKSHIISRDRHNSTKSTKVIRYKTIRSLKRLNKRVEKLKDIGVEFDSSNLEKSIKARLDKQLSVAKKETDDSSEMKKDESILSAGDTSHLTNETDSKTGGSILLLEDDISDDEIQIKTPPNCVKRSKLNQLSKKELRKVKTIKTAKAPSYRLFPKPKKVKE
ncbi:MKI67 FHA domain-interacting nucleolar phosphoprotein-like [Octopus bimaculoides]|uniref:RRM domain-containing protein n=1 Tax=Octopus bimaculoides TaxID=37653 RepID=A0A0L8I9Z3_OCTBM|nr:MKI67 FHA domain-interacting nucleolar phosphoprotein-like [Octopus bimaculoides]|eukprot:XP_014783311.1 PREDICTED: MKI67 FHA domain-interacting nucleolar phosphoprotein-like [Octopus bimaculoides]